jgi:hypothetical protein
VKQTRQRRARPLLCCGPAGGGGYRGQITPSVITHSAYLDREQVATRITMIET